jgi:hypothetical protein
MLALILTANSLKGVNIMIILKEVQQIIDFAQSLDLDDDSIVLVLQDAIEVIAKRNKRVRVSV